MISTPGASPRSTPPPLAVTTGSWRPLAACLRHPHVPASAWDDMPGPGRQEGPGGREQRVARAKAVCRTECPVREACLADVDLDYDEGIRGGEDLRDLKAARRRARARSAA